ncbi:cytochrome c oxidase subunit 4 [Rhodoligotrophos appendicifer]|uniref:cytochrome C oxidase subunit IV family protein n=1 Tax=Rhodoligotrophos appendicifer TaxID=987056 RepID=UPI0014794D06|nr:cytochrome C oxidase subunit IV family protein [Rhodoligotrophos appendicifer]
MKQIRPILLTWAALLGLLAATVGASFVLTGPLSLAAGLVIAAAKAALIYWVFMHLREESGLVRIFAMGAGAWLMILCLLSMSDYVTRSTG